MKESKIEIVKYPKVKHIRIFVNEINCVEKHIHNDIELFVVLNGSGQIKLNSNEYSFREGDMYLINSCEVHSLSSFNVKESKFQKEPVALFVQISNHFVREYFQKIKTTIFESVDLRSALRQEEYKELCGLILETATLYFSEPEYFQLDIVSNITKLLSILFKNVKNEVINETQRARIQKYQRRLERIVSIIDDNFDSKIKLEDIAKMENLSTTHLSHIFSDSFGITFQEFVNVKRTEKCIRLMANKEKTLLEIAYESGFSDTKYMNKMFVKMFGCSPKEFRKKMPANTKCFDSKTGKSETIYDDSAALKRIKAFKDYQ